MKIEVGQPSFDRHEIENVLTTLDREWITMGRYVDEFEREFARFIGVKHAIAVTNGTAALHVALVALGIGAGDEVIIPATTFIATANAVTYTGAKPVVVDVDPFVWNIDQSAILEAITPNTKAIIPVHLYGMPANMTNIEMIARNYGLFVVEDAAEALGAKWLDKHVGTIGDLGCFSFYGNKTITTGEGGMVVTNDDGLAERVRKLRGQGQTDQRYWHDEVGFNYRMTDMQAAVGCAQLAKLPLYLQKREMVWEWYIKYLPSYVIVQAHGGKSGYWALAILLPTWCEKEAAVHYLAEKGIATRPVFYPVDSMPMYGGASDCPNAIKISKRGLVLPLHTGLAEAQVRYICESLGEVIDEQLNERRSAIGN